MQILTPSVELLFITPNAAQFIEKAGRTCYKSEDLITPESADKFVTKVCRDLRHFSVIEHVHATMRFICDRGVQNEIVRHRVGAAYSVESSRYINYSKAKHGHGIKVIPMQDNLTDAQKTRREVLWQHIEDVYLAEVSEGIAPQQARDNLPICLKTEMVVTYNARMWIHVFESRLSKFAHPQIRKLMLMAWDVLRAECPVIFDLPELHELVKDLR